MLSTMLSGLCDAIPLDEQLAPKDNLSLPSKHSSPSRAYPSSPSSERDIDNNEVIEDSDSEEEDATEEDYNIKEEDEERDDEDFVMSSRFGTLDTSTDATQLKKKARPAVNKAIKSPKKKRVCDFCGCSDTPMWRRGPQGKGTLCNACGVKWSLKFRKRAGKKKEKLNEKEGSNSTKKSKSSMDDYRKNYTSRKNSSLQSTSDKKRTKEFEPSASPPEKEEMKEYYCKYCHVTWPLGHFKNTQQFGAHCSNCSRKQRPAVAPVEDEFQKREREADTSNNERNAKRQKNSYKTEQQQSPPNDWEEEAASGDEVDINANLLLGRLLNVVENQLVEEQELAEIRKHLFSLKDELFQKEEVRKRKLEDARTTALSGLQEFRLEMVSLINSKESFLQARIEQIGTEPIAELSKLRNQLDAIQKNLATPTNSGDNLQASADLDGSIKNIQKQLESLQSNIENHFTDLRIKMTHEPKSFIADCSVKVDTKETKVKYGVEELSKELDKQFAHRSAQFTRLEEALTANSPQF